METLHPNTIKNAKSLLINTQNNQFIPVNPAGSPKTGLEPSRSA